MPVALWLIAALMAITLAAAFSRPARVAIAAIAAKIAIASVWVVAHAAPEVAAETMATLVVALDTTKPAVEAAAAVLIKSITGQDVDVPTLFSPDTGPYLGAGGAGAFDGIARGIASAIAPEGDLSPESGMENLTRLFGVNLGAHLQGWFISVLADAIDLGKLRSLAALHNTIEGGIGFRNLGRLMWRGPIEEAITKPVKAHYARLYMPVLPTAGETVSGWYQNVYSDADAIDLLRSAGYSYARAQELLTINQKKLTTAEALDLWRAGSLDDDGLRALVREQGYGVARTELIVARERDTATRTVLAELATEARTLFKAGDITEDELRGFLAEARYKDDEIALIVAREQLALRAEKGLTATQLLDAYEQALIDDQTLRTSLRKQHYPDDSIDVLMALRTKKLTPAQVTEAFARGLLPANAAALSLKRLGYGDQDIPVLLDLRARKLTQGQILDALNTGLINAETARQQLGQLGFPTETIDLLLAFQRKTLTPAEVQAAVVRGLLDPGTAITRLVAAGYSRDDANLIVELRFRLMTTGQTLDAYGDGLIGRADAIADLQARGLSPDDALTVVRVFDLKAIAAQAKKAATPKPPPAAPGP
jgi:hypothetical protein